jgi:hypothetical protein
MNVLVLNCGSSSLKFQIIATDLERIERNADQRLAEGQIERIGGAALISFTAEGRETERSAAPIRDVRAALETVLRWISESGAVEGINNLADIQAIGHRVVHGGEKFKAIGYHHGRSFARHRRLHRTRAAAQSGEYQRNYSGPRNFRQKRSAGGCFRHGVSPNFAGKILSLRDSVSILPPPQNSPLRFSRHFASLYRLSLPHD